MRAIFFVGIALVVGGRPLGAQDSLSAAKELYASAAYEDALSTLSRLDGAASGPDVTRQVAEYRAFCLYALGRTREAESVAESIIRKEPLAQLDAADASPRLETMFTDVRRRLLPSLVRERFRAARAALDEKSFSAAEPKLAEAQLMIAEAEKLGVKDDGLADMSLLVDGFLQLIRSAADQRTAPSPARVAGSADAAAAQAPPRSGASPSPPAASGSRVYTLGDEGVSPPVAIEQRLPAMTREMETITKALRTSGILDLLIDESGHVVDATIRQSINRSFDMLLVRAAQRWKYEPAMKDGTPVRFVKTIVLVP